MLIDWFTVLAEAVNFLILVALLKRFLYGPLLKAIDSREQRIASALSEAERKRQEAEALDAKARDQLANLEAIREQAIAHARDEAERERRKMTEAARDSVRALESRWQEDLRREEAVFLADLRGAAGSEILAIARNAVTDLAGADLDSAAAQALVRKLDRVDLGGQTLTVVSATQLGLDVRAGIVRAIDAHSPTPPQIGFETDPALGWGVEIRCGGRRIGWTPAAYLDALEDRLRAVIDEQVEAGSCLASL